MKLSLKNTERKTLGVITANFKKSRANNTNGKFSVNCVGTL